MLQSLSIRNFKSWPKLDLALGKITGLFGVNSSGKSSIIQLLLLLKQTKEATDRAISLELNGSWVNLGVYRDLIHGHDETLPLIWHLSFLQDKELALVDPKGKRKESFAKGRELTVRSRVVAHERGAYASALEYELADARFRIASKDDGRASPFELRSFGSDFRFKRTTGRKWQLPGPVKSYAFPDQARTYFQNASFLSDLEAAFEEQIDRIHYLGPLRDFPQRDYLWTRSRRRDVGLRGEKTIDAILAATLAGETRNITRGTKLRPFQEMVAYWLRTMGLISSFEVREIAPGSDRWQAFVQVRPNGPEALLTDVGFGVSQVLPVVTLLQYVPEGSTVILEQPEIHLHPLAQAGLADLILNAALHRRIQVVLESHSEHLLLRLQRRVAEGRIPGDDVKIYFCDANDQGSRLRDLGLDLFGNITNWPPKFMGDAFGETFAAEEARLRRMEKKR